MRDTAAEIVAEALLADAEAHGSHRYDVIGEEFDDVLADVLPLADAKADHVNFAFTFWDGWIDARNHDWLYYEGIGKDDWPSHARSVAACLQAGSMPDDPVLRRHFESQPRTPLRTRVMRFLLGRQLAE